MRAGFFVREADSTVKGERSYLEFNFPDRLAGVLDRVPGPRPERVQGERRGNAVPRPEPYPGASELVTGMASTGAAAMARRELVTQPELTVPSVGQPKFVTAGPPKKKWPWLAGWALLVIAAAVFGLRYWGMTAGERTNFAGRGGARRTTAYRVEPCIQTGDGGGTRHAGDQRREGHANLRAFAARSDCRQLHL